MIRLALIRHGHTSWNREGRIQGRTDIPLDEVARAELSARRLPDGWQDAEIWASPLSRAVETARLISGRDPQTDPALIEMDWGAWEGHHREQLDDDPSQDYRPIETWGWHYRAPGGEGPDNLRKRLMPWIAARQTDTIAVCHIGVMRVILAIASGWHFDGPAPFLVKRNRLFVVEIDGTTLRIVPETPRLIEVSS